MPPPRSAALFGGYFPGLLVPARTGAGSRQRDLPRVTVFWAFLGQVLLRGASCRWALARVQADAVGRGRRPPGDATGAYCQARCALPLPWLQALFEALSRWFERRTTGQWRGRTVRLIDATGFSMPDTARNRRCWPYAAGQKPGCGFPTGKLVGLFCLHTGRLLAFAQGAWKAHDLSLARQRLAHLRAGEVLVADRAYCGWLFLAQLLGQKVDFVIRRHQARLVRPGRARSWREDWKKPQRPRGSMLSRSSDSASRARSTPCRPGPSGRSAPAVIAATPGAHCSPASPPIRSLGVPAAMNLARGSDEPKTINCSAGPATACMFPLPAGCGENGGLFHSRLI